MVDKCCAPGCQNKRELMKGRAFYRLPKDKHRRKKWIEAINRPEQTVKKSENTAKDGGCKQKPTWNS